MSVVKIRAKKRDQFGRRNVKQLRQNGVVPGVFYKEGTEAMHLEFEEKSLSHFLHNAHGLVDLGLDGEKTPLKCVLKEVQYHPVSENVLHVDFMGVNMDKEMQIMVPVMLQGEARGVKTGGFLQHSMREILIECLPADLPDQIEVDISHLEIGMSIQVKDLELGTIKILEDPNDSIVLVEQAKIMKTESDADAEEMVEDEDSEEVDEDAEETE